MSQRLDDYCEENFGELVRILRAPTRFGLIKAKNYGARNGSFCFFQLIKINMKHFSSNRRCSYISRRTL